jgi:hypothetical protein
MSGDGIWYVKLADGDVDRLTLDQLDEAFQKGQIDENTVVLGDGTTRWLKLGELLGSSEPAVTPAAPAQATRPPVAALAPAQAATQRPVGANPMPPAPTAPVARSLRPVSVDLSDTDLEQLRGGRSSRKRLVFGAAGTLLVLGTATVFVTRHGALSTSSDPPQQLVAAAAPPPTEPARPSTAEATSTAGSGQASLPGPSSVMDPTMNRLTEDQKKKILDVDKTSKTHQKAHASGGGGSRHPSAKEKSSTFTTNGNKFDPLNSNL